MDGRCMTQAELAERWRISEATLERWHTESNGPLFLKLGNQVRSGFNMLKHSTRSRCADRPKQTAGSNRLLQPHVLHFGLPRMPRSPLDRLRSGCALALATNACVCWSPHGPCPVDDCKYRQSQMGPIARSIRPTPTLVPRLPAPDTPNRQSHRSAYSQ